MKCKHDFRYWSKEHPCQCAFCGKDEQEKILITKDKMAWVYVGIISVLKFAPNYPIEALNKKIIAKWSKKGLKYIKQEAWKHIKELHIELENNFKEK